MLDGNNSLWLGLSYALAQIDLLGITLDSRPLNARRAGRSVVRDGAPAPHPPACVRPTGRH